MNTRIMSKLTIFAAAFVINGLMFVGINYLFNDHMHQRAAWISLAQAASPATRFPSRPARGTKRISLRA
jgi:hypothetical protein